MKYWISVVVLIILFILGGYIVYPKEPYVIYENIKYYGYPNSLELVSKDNNKIIVDVDYESYNKTITLSNDNVIIKIIQNEINIVSDSFNETYNINFSEEEVNTNLLKYVKLAKTISSHDSLMLEDFSIAIYITLAVFFFVGLFVLKLAINLKKKESIISYVLLMIFSIGTMTFTLFVNLFLVIQHL